MSNSKPPSGDEQAEALVRETRRHHMEQEKTYRARALKMYPHVCGRCGREFSGKRLKELTVHHRNHDHDDNPSDGSNWELLCLYCHDNEHARNAVAAADDGHLPSEPERPKLSHNPFAGLGDWKKKD